MSTRKSHSTLLFWLLLVPIWLSPAQTEAPEASPLPDRMSVAGETGASSEEEYPVVVPSPIRHLFAIQRPGEYLSSLLRNEDGASLGCRLRIRHRMEARIRCLAAILLDFSDTIPRSLTLRPLLYPFHYFL